VLRSDVPGATVDDVELLVPLVITGHGVGVAVDDLDRPLGVLELHRLLTIAVTSNMLHAFLLSGRHVIVMGLLLLLLAELLCKLLDLRTLLGTVAPRVVHRASRPTLVAARGL
jgi:hypothetical protein